MARNPHKQGGLATPPPELDDDDANPVDRDDESRPVDTAPDDPNPVDHTPDDKPASESAGDAPDGDGGDQGDDAGDDPADEGPGKSRLSKALSGTSAGRGRAISVANDGAGWVLGLVFWAGVALPFIQGGPDRVKAWWLAKFFNHAPDGSDLP